MRKTFFILFLFLITGAIEYSFGLTPEQVIDKADEVMYPDSFFMLVTMVTKGPGIDRSMTLESYHKDGVGSFMEILKPARSKGMRFLQKENTLWMFNPKSRSRKAIRLSPKGAFQGSVFSNNDVSDPDYADDYDTAFLANEFLEHAELGRMECYVIEGSAKDEKTSYARIKVWCTIEDFLPLKFQYYAKSGMLFKEMELSGFKQLAGRLRPTIINMKSFEQKDTISTVTIEKLEIRDNLSDSMFTQEALKR